MLEVISLHEAKDLVRERFHTMPEDIEAVPLDEALGRVIAHDIVAAEGVPPFNRSMVDGFAVMASDTFGCSNALPALLELIGEVDMGAEAPCECKPKSCVRIPTGGQVPEGADAVVMLEHCEDYGDGTVGVGHAVAPGENVVYKNDDVMPGQLLIRAGTPLDPHHVGTLASLGASMCDVRARRRVAVISTGDEIVDVSATPKAAQMRDVNAPLLASAIQECGAVPIRYPIVADEFGALERAVARALEDCDDVIVTGGSSAGAKDNTARVFAAHGELLFHGIAVKPGKPTLCADIDGKAAFGLPGHPVAAYFMFLEIVRPLLASTDRALASCQATLAENVPSNHGRTELVAVRVEQGDGFLRALPIRAKSGLISQLAHADGYITIPRNHEGLPAGTPVSVRLFHEPCGKRI